MKKTIIILLTALLLLTVFVSCEGDIEDMFGKTVSFNGNGSTSGQMAEMKVKKREEVTLPANEFARTDYVFAGWNTQADGSGTGYADKAKASFDDNTVLYAQWAEELTITFNANDGSGTMDPVKVSAGVYELPENGFTAPEGYAFVRWSETADGEVEYEVGDELEVTEDVTLYAIWAEILTNTKTSWTGRYTINDDLDYLATRIQVDNVAKLYLPDDLTLNAKKGITVTVGNTLIIDKVGTKGNGTLLIDDVGSNFAGIGGGYDCAGGTVTINGGTVTATGGEHAAGIGGGYYGDGGTVTINGGTVNASGGDGGAGIGGGYEGAGGKVTINGGTVTANGGKEAAGIGCGSYGDGGKVTISGGTVTATGGEHAAGIGGGAYDGDGGTVTINGGTVTATGGSGNELHGSGAGIGGGCYGDGGTVTISGGTVTATGGSGSENYGPGIGAGGGSSSHGTLTIGENPTTPYTDGKLRIASGWFLYYGESSASTSIGEGTYDSWSDYAKKYMNVTQP